MKKTLLMSAALSVFALSAQALDLTPYISAKAKFIDFNGRMSMLDEDFKTGMDINSDAFGGAIALGVADKLCSGDAIRLELEYNITDKGETTMWGGEDGLKVKTSAEAYMLNAYYDFDLDSKFTPYIGAGIGSAKAKYKFSNDYGISQSFSDRKFAYQFGAGIAYAATEHVSIDFGYRYMDYGNFKKSIYYESLKFDTSANEFYVGLRYSF